MLLTMGSSNATTTPYSADLYYKEVLLKLASLSSLAIVERVSGLQKPSSPVFSNQSWPNRPDSTHLGCQQHQVSARLVTTSFPIQVPESELIAADGLQRSSICSWVLDDLPPVKVQHTGLGFAPEPIRIPIRLGSQRRPYPSCFWQDDLTAAAAQDLLDYCLGNGLRLLMGHQERSPLSEAGEELRVGRSRMDYYGSDLGSVVSSLQLSGKTFMECQGRSLGCAVIYHVGNRKPRGIRRHRDYHTVILGHDMR